MTITTSDPHGFSVGAPVTIAGVGVAGYNGTFIITAATASTFTYTATAGLAASSGGTATGFNAGIIILEPPSITKSFSPSTVAVSAASTVTFTIKSGNVVPINTSFSDNLPTGLVVANLPGVVNNCGGTVTAVASATSISFSNSEIEVINGSTCTIQVNVQSSADNSYSNSVTIDSTDAGNGNTSTASLTVINPPNITKGFAAGTIPLNGTTSLTFTLSTTNSNLTLNGVAYTDNLPAGLVVATPGNLNSTCSGIAAAQDGASSVSLSGASLAPGASCTVSVNVTGTTAGIKNNTVTVTSTEGGTGNTSNASITVVVPPVIIKAFGAASIPLSGSTALIFTIQNNNSTGSLSGVGFSDTLPAGLVVSTPNGLTGSCGGGSITATAGTNGVSLSGAAIVHGASCTFSVNVTGTAAGQQNNTTGAVTSTEGGTGGTASASVIVVAPPVMAKAFNPATIALNGTTTLTFTLTNPAANTVAETGVAFADALPAGLLMTVPNGLSNTCNGTATATAGSGSISLTGGSIAVNTSCTVVVNVTGTASGQYTSTSGAVSSTNGGSGNTASANLTVASPPSIIGAFGAATIPLNGVTSLNFTLTNPNAQITLSGVGFADSLPAGVVVAAPNGLTNTCGGTATAGAGSGAVNLSGGTLAASASCTVTVNVTGTTAGIKNNSAQVTSTTAGAGNTSNASLTVVGPPTIAKSFAANNIALNGSTTLTFTIHNPNTTVSLSGIGFTDQYPSGLVTSAPLALGGSCNNGTISGGSNQISLSGESLAAGASCTVSVSVTGTVAGQMNNTTGAVTSHEGGTGGSASATLVVVAPPVIAVSFSPTTISLNGNTTLTYTLTNPSVNTVALTGVTFTDTLPTGLVVANLVSGSCSGGAGITVGPPSIISLPNGTIPANSACTIVLTVTGTASGPYTVSTGPVSSNNGGTGNTATANLTVASPPSISKAFGAATIPLNGTTTLTFNVTNPNTQVTLTGVGFTDSLPAGLVVSSPNGVSNTCGGTATAVAGSGSVSLTLGSLTSTATCKVTVNVQGTGAGVKNNSVTVTSTEGGPGNTATASLTVIAPPTITTSFGAASIPLNGSTSLTFTILNTNTTVSLSGVGFSDTLPGVLVISTPDNGLTGTCGGGPISATAGGTSISLSGAFLAPNSFCTFSVNVTGTAAGQQSNTTGNVNSLEGGLGNQASASITVVPPPQILKSFSPTQVALDGNSTLTFTISSPGGLPLNNDFEMDANGTTPPFTGWTESFYGGSDQGTVGNAPWGAHHTYITTARSFSGTKSVYSYVQNAGGQDGPVNDPNTRRTTSALKSAPFSTSANTLYLWRSAVSYTPTSRFNWNIWVELSDSVTTQTYLLTCLDWGGQEGCSGNYQDSQDQTATGTDGQTWYRHSFAIPAGMNKSNLTMKIVHQQDSWDGTTGDSNLYYDLVDGDVTGGSTQTGVAFTDTLQSGLQVASSPAINTTCGGTLTATPGSTTVSLSGASLAAGTICTVSLSATGTVSGLVNNSVQATSLNGGAGNTATATLLVAYPPSIAKAFGAATIPLSGSTALTFTVTNPATNTISLTGLAFTDSLPAGLVVATPGNLGGTCNGTATAADGASAVTLSGASLAPAASCTVTVNVQGTIAGVRNNSVTATSTEGGPGNTSHAQITVVAPPAITKSFVASSIPLGGTTTLTFSLQNSNATVALSGVAFSDTLPAGLVVASHSGLTGSCGNGAITATAGGTSISLSGGTLASSGSCTFSVNVMGTAAGQQNNVTSAVTSNEGGTGGTASASLAVVAPPVIAVSFNPTTISLNGTTTLTYTLTNPTLNTVALTGVAFTNTFPTGLVLASEVSSSCAGWFGSVGPPSYITLPNATIPANSSCSMVFTVKGTASGQYTISTGAVSSTNGGTGNTATANLTVASPPSISKAFGAATIPLNGTTSLTFSLTNPNTQITLTGVGFADSLPAGLVVALPSGLTNTCGGTAAALAGASSVGLGSGSLTSSATCKVTVNVQGIIPGVQNNSVQATSTEGGPGNTATASITVVAPPVIGKQFGTNSIPLGGTTSLTFTFVNPNGTVSLSGVGMTDTLPAGLVVSTPNGVNGSCGNSAITATAGTNVISMSGATLAANGSCTYSLNVTGIAAGQQNNVTSQVTSTEAGTGKTASAMLIVVAPPVIAKAFSPTTIVPNGVSTLTITVTNAAVNTVGQTGVAFTDNLPANLVVATPNGLTSTCGGTPTAVAGSASISLANGTIAVNSSCTVTVNVTGATPGLYTNATGAVTSTNGGTGNTATATLRVAFPPSISKAFGAATIPLSGATSLTFTIQNPNAVVVTLNGVAFTDILPAGLSVASTPLLMNSCGGTATALAGSGTVTLAGGSMAPNTSCSVSVIVQGTMAGVKNNSVQVTSTEGGAGNTANASITVVAPPGITKGFGAASILLNGTTTLTFTLQNSNATQSLSGISFGDLLPAGLAVATPNGLTGSCGAGTITATAGLISVNLTGGTLAANGSCVFSVNVRGVHGGLQTNTTGTVSSNEGGTGSYATANLTVNPIGSTTGLAVPGSSHFGESITLTATVSSTYGTPTGSVSFFDGTNALGSAMLTSGTATLNTSSLTLGTHSITAQYLGSADYTGSTSTAMTQNVTTPLVTVNLGGGSSLTVPAGQTGTFTFTVGSAGTLSAPIVFSCSGLPAGANCIFSPPSVGPSNLPATVTLFITTTRLQIVGQNRGIDRFGLACAALLPAMFLLTGSRRRRRLLGTAMLLLLLLTLMFGLGCGGSASGGITNGSQYTAAGSYPITVTATSAGAVTSTSNLTIIVTR